jgi:hypothetical protein
VTDALPDKLPAPPSGLLVIFSPGTFSWIGTALQTIYLAQKAQLDRQDAVIAALGPLTGALEGLMATIADLTAAVQQIDVKVDALIAAYEAAKNNPDTHFSAADQAALDAAVGGLQSELDQVDTANPPTP